MLRRPHLRISPRRARRAFAPWVVAGALSGDGPLQRVDATGFVGRTWGENIAGGSATAKGTMQQWLGSPGHRLNIMRPGFTLFGGDYFRGGAYRYSWTQVFGG
jgi:uncharacterized protein YkwD